MTTSTRRHALRCECIPAAQAAILLPWSASLRGRAGHRLRLGDDRCLRAFHLADLASEEFLFLLKSRLAGAQFSQLLITCKLSGRRLTHLRLFLGSLISPPPHPSPLEEHQDRAIRHD